MNLSKAKTVEAEGAVTVRQRSAHPTTTTPAARLVSAELLFDRGLLSEASSELTTLLKSSPKDRQLLAQARCLLAKVRALEGHYGESLDAIKSYEFPDARSGLDAQTDIQLRVQLGAVFNYRGEFPKAIAFLNAALRDTPDTGADSERGAIYEALARVYRSIHEHAIARDHSLKALEHYRRTGEWRGLAETTAGLAVLEMSEGRYEASLKHCEQAAKLVGNRHAPFLLGRIYGNMGGVCCFLRRPYDGIRHLEKAISYYESTDHRMNAAFGYNNLGLNLILAGKWERAQEALKRALELAFKLDERSAQVAMILASLGELRVLRGELEEARSLLERAIQIASAKGNKFYTGQALRSLTRFHIAAGEIAQAVSRGREALALAEYVKDRQGLCESHLLLAEAHLLNGEREICSTLLRKVTDLVEYTVVDMAISSETQRLSGLLAMDQGNAMLAAHHFGRSVSIYEILGDRYRSACAYFDLGRAYAEAQPERAHQPLAMAVQIFRELDARLDLTRAEAALAAFGSRVGQKVSTDLPLRSHRSILRMTEAVAARDLLLREFAALIRHETMAHKVLILEPEPEDESRQRVVTTFGYEASEAEQLAETWSRAGDKERDQIAAREDAAVMSLRVVNATPATLFVSPRAAVEFAGREEIETLLRVAEMGLDLSAVRERLRESDDDQYPASQPGASLIPGFIHSSPVMTRLVEEMHKIRSSDVTVLVTGESGTGKELVARAIHTLSSRRDKVFVPFNCTAVPRELSEGYLFGYRRGAFTGAVADSPGVIRTAAGGTLFIDEVGDLPLDVQPKLLRFLQEGEIQALGEQRPQQVDVRIIAATNCDLENMVKLKQFREDLYYRLNVIRLEVPPLRERRSEIPAIVNHYLDHYAAKFGKSDLRMTSQAVDLLTVHDWPGNVRQLCNELQRAIALAADGSVITPDQLSTEVRRLPARGGSPESLPSSDSSVIDHPSDLLLSQAVENLERSMIAEALKKHKGNVSRASRELGLTRRGLQLKLGRYGMAASV